MSNNNNAHGQHEFDYIVVGAGSAGCLLANRLSADPANRVLLIEAGGRDNYHWIHIPVGYLYCIDNPRTDWRFRTEPDPGLNGRSLIYPRGKTLGGCSSINGMLYIRGQARDYNHWADVTGEQAWSWDNCLPDFMRHEDHYRLDEEGDADPEHGNYHGHGGEWRIEHQRLKWTVLEDFASACVQAGIPRTRDFNRGDNEGVDYFEVNQRSGWRWSTSKAFLRPAKTRPNLTLWHSTHVMALDMAAGEKPRCTGVRVERPGEGEITAHATPRSHPLSRRYRIPPVAAAVGHWPGGSASRARYPGCCRLTRRRRESSGSPADSIGLQGSGREDPEHHGQLTGWQGTNWAGVFAYPLRPHEHGPLPNSVCLPAVPKNMSTPTSSTTFSH